MCIVCKHNQVKDIDRALLTGASLTSLSKKYGFTTDYLDRHQKHLVHKTAQCSPLETQNFCSGRHPGRPKPGPAPKCSPYLGAATPDTGPHTATHPKTQREISAKLARN
jgi:hypothetical protein